MAVDHAPSMTTPSATSRIAGFDLARAYAILGMYIVNFNYAFGSFADTSYAGRFLNLFVGNSTAVFIILAGIGLSLMSHRPDATPDEKKKIRSVVLKRSWFLVIVGLALFTWWPGDILHFYGAYMHVAAFLLFVPKKYYLLSAGLAILIFHLLLLVIPIETGWDFVAFQPTDFWTLAGFVRNTFYNGWNSVFPWIAYFLLGMWLGRLNWNGRSVRSNVFFTGLIVFVLIEGLRMMTTVDLFGDAATAYILSEYFPPYLPFMLVTAGFALMVIPCALWIGEKFATSEVMHSFSAVGRMTLTHYISHLTLGMPLFSVITGLKYTGAVQQTDHASPGFILGFAVGYFLLSAGFSILWNRKFKTGPVESLMRRFSK